MKKISLDKIHLVIINFIRLLIVIAIISAIISGKWLILFACILILFLTFLPYFFEKKYKIQLPLEFTIVIILFIYVSLILGSIKGYYLKFWWWDIITHTTAGIALGFIGFMILYILYQGKKIRANPIMIAIFSFSFAVAIGVLWEIFEFVVDSLTGLNMQKSGLRDTMWDLIVNSIGALFASTMGYLYLKKEKIHVVDMLINKFRRKNPNLFK